MSKRAVFGVLVAIVAVAAASPVFAQEAGAAAAKSGSDVIAMWSIITAGFALAIAAGLGALGQGKAIAAACEGIARNPGAAGAIRLAMIIGLALIESLVIYALIIAYLAMGK